MSKPKVLVSQCIEHGHCRYDGSQISSEFVRNLADYVTFITVCPEVAIGLPIPREAVRIIEEEDEKRLVFSMTGRDVTEKMQEFSREFADNLQQVHGILLKGRSPSCGIKDVKVYRTIGRSPALGKKTLGFFAKEIIKRYPLMAIEDEGRLTNYTIREHFLTRIYTMERFDAVIEEGTISALVKFHSENKYLLMAYHQANQKQLGKITANHENNKAEVVIENYKIVLEQSLLRPLRRGTNINMLMHLLGYFKTALTKEEKAYFLDLLENYSMKKLPLSVPIAVIHSWVIRFKEPYLSRQTIFRPYPKEIMDVADSGKKLM